MKVRMIIRNLALAAALILAAPLAAEVPLDPGQTATIRLSPQRDLVYPIAPPLTQPPVNHGAILSIDIDEPGRYHVALGARGWIEQVRDGRSVPSVGHDHGKAGSGVAKIVDFDLTPGHYIIALSGMADGQADVTVSK